MPISARVMLRQLLTLLAIATGLAALGVPAHAAADASEVQLAAAEAADSDATAQGVAPAPTQLRFYPAPVRRGPAPEWRAPLAPTVLAGIDRARE